MRPAGDSLARHMQGYEQVICLLDDEVSDALNGFVARRLVEAAQYPDGDPLLMLVFGAMPDETKIAGDDSRVHVRWAIDTYEDWVLLERGTVVGRRGDTAEMDIAAFGPVLGSALTTATISPDDGTLSLGFESDHQVLVLPSRDEFIPAAITDSLWTITRPDLVLGYIGGKEVRCWRA